ncbi:MAG: MafI family immunity protein [Verrucomicrobia bacterium]|nr:MafI family immunity protein [Verrucomicrobiota bacterium]
MTDQQYNFEEKMEELFKQTINNLPAEDVEEINDYITHGECGVAYDHLVSQLFEYDISISSETYELIAEFGKFMGYEESEWGHLKSLIKAP